MGHFGDHHTLLTHMRTGIHLEPPLTQTAITHRYLSPNVAEMACIEAHLLGLRSSKVSYLQLAFTRFKSLRTPPPHFSNLDLAQQWIKGEISEDTYTRYREIRAKAIEHQAQALTYALA